MFSCMIALCLLVVQLTQTANGTGDFIFPDQSARYTEPKCVRKDEDSDFCLKVENYPKRTIENLLKKLSALDVSAYFSDSKEESFSPANPSDATTFDNRFGEDGEETLCYSEMSVLHPEALQDRQKINRTIVNTEQFRQAVRVEKCKFFKNDRRCKLSEHFPNNYKTECKQIFIKKKLMTYKPQGNGKEELEPVEFDIPSCCQCVYRIGDDFNKAGRK